MEQCQVQQSQINICYQVSLDGIMGQQMCFGNVMRMCCVNNNDIKYYCVQCIYGQIVVNEVVRKCSVLISFSCCVDRICRLDNSGNRQDDQCDNFQWCKEVVYGIQQFVWIE